MLSSLFVPNPLKYPILPDSLQLFAPQRHRKPPKWRTTLLFKPWGTSAWATLLASLSQQPRPQWRTRACKLPLPQRRSWIWASASKTIQPGTVCIVPPPTVNHGSGFWKPKIHSTNDAWPVANHGWSLGGTVGVPLNSGTPAGERPALHDQWELLPIIRAEQEKKKFGQFMWHAWKANIINNWQ